MTLPDTIPWIEKYRPKNLSEISSQKETIAVLGKMMNTGNLPHCLFYGPAGTGKTSTILALARQLYGPKLMKNRVLELNASDERGISVIREKVKDFAKLSVSTTSQDGEYPCPPYKIIILDECDSMSNDAQAALRRTMETYSKQTRFVLICNYVSRIIEPLASRCAKFRFIPLESESILNRLNYIASNEGVTMDSLTLDALIMYSQGDLRKAIMFLQSAHKLYGNQGLNPTGIANIAGAVPLETVQELLGVWISKDIDQIQVKVSEFIRQGYSVSQLLLQISDLIVDHVHLSGIQKAKMALNIGLADGKLTLGADEELQLLSVFVSC